MYARTHSKTQKLFCSLTLYSRTHSLNYDSISSFSTIRFSILLAPSLEHACTHSLSPNRSLARSPTDSHTRSLSHTHTHTHTHTRSVAHSFKRSIFTRSLTHNSLPLLYYTLAHAREQECTLYLTLAHSPTALSFLYYALLYLLAPSRARTETRTHLNTHSASLPHSLIHNSIYLFSIFYSLTHCPLLSLSRAFCQ